MAGNGTAGYSGDEDPATGASLNSPIGMATDQQGNLYIADSGNNVIRKVNANGGVISTVAGNGTAGFSGDGGAATSAELNGPASVAVDSAGDLYIADTGNMRIRRVDSQTFTITTVAGTGTAAYSGDGGPASAASLSSPTGVALDSVGNLYIVDASNYRIRVISASTGNITTIAGNGTSGDTGDGGAATSAEVGSLFGVAVDSLGNLYFTEGTSHKVRKITASTGIITTAAGNGTQGTSGDGGPATSAELSSPIDVAVDAGGDLYIADTALSNENVREVNASTGIITSVAGTPGEQGEAGDGGPAAHSSLGDPSGVAVDATGNLYISNIYDNYVRKVSLLALPSTNVASSATAQNMFLQTTAAETITSLKVAASLGNKQEYSVGTVTGCAVDGITSNPAGTICTVPVTFSPAYPGRRAVPLQAVTSAGNTNIGLTAVGVGPLAALTPGIITTIAGDGDFHYTGDGGPATSAGLYEPEGLALDSAGNIYFADFYEQVVRRIDATTGIITTVAGSGTIGAGASTGGFSGDGGPATSAQLNAPEGISFDSAGNLYIADAGNYRIRRVDAETRIITTVAGNGGKTDSGDGGAATNASFKSPTDVRFDSHNNMYIADSSLIRRVDASSGIITSIAGNGTGGDGGPAISASISPFSLAFDSQDNLYLVDPYNNTVRVIYAQSGTIATVAGNGTAGSTDSGDGGPATSASLNGPNFVTVDSAGDLYITESTGSYLRYVNADTGIISTIGGTGQDSANVPGDGGPATAATISSPTGIGLDGLGNIYISSYVAERIRKINVSESALTWPTTTNVGTPDDSDNPETAILTDIGNYQMSVPFASSPADPVITNGWSLDSTSTCSSNSLHPLTLFSGQACTLPVDFTPTMTGTNNGTLVLTDNSLNVPTSTQTITLTGTGAGAATPAQAVLSPSSLNFAATTTTAASNQVITLSNPGGTTLNISSIAITGNNPSAFTIAANTCSTTLAASASCSITIAFPETTAGTYNADLSVMDDASPLSLQTASLTGTVTSATAPGTPAATLTPATLTFSEAAGGAAPASQTLTLTNTGSATLSIAGISLDGSTPYTFAETNSCGASLAAGVSCTITVSFGASTAGTYGATLSVSDNASPQVQTATLIGTVTSMGAPVATLTPATLTYSATTGTTSAAQIATLTNTGTATLNISGISLAGSNTSAFTIGANTCGATLAAGASCTVSVSFDPNAVGSFTAAISVTDDAAGSPQTSALTGTGTAVAATADFTLSATPATQSVTAGNAATYAVNINSTGGSFTNAVTLTAAGLPPGATLAFSPTNVTPGSAGAQATMTVQTAATQSAIRNDMWTGKWRIPYLASLLLLIPGWRARRRWNAKLGRALFMGLGCVPLLLGAVTGLAGCGGGFAMPQTSAASTTYTITVTGTSGSVQHNTTVQITVE